MSPAPFLTLTLILILILFILSTSLTTAQILSTTTTPTLNVTAIATRNGTAVFECWQLAAPFATSAVPGTAGALALPLAVLGGNASYTVIPPRFEGGLHRAPVDQYVIFLSGLAHITLPNSTDEIWVRGGKDGLIVAADGQSEFGHVTTYPGGADTVAVQVPWEVAPGYEVLYGGGCREEEMVGI